MKINFYLIEYALGSLVREKTKNFFIFFVLSLMIFILSSFLFIASSIKSELETTLSALPDITIQQLRGGRHVDIDTHAIDKILTIHGVSDAVARVWGYYYFANAGVTFSLVGIDAYEMQYTSTLQDVADIFSIDDESMVVGEGVEMVLNQNHYNEYFNFLLPNGGIKKLAIGGVFDSQTSLESNDMMILSKDNLREIFDMPSNKATDIVVKVANPEEINIVVSKMGFLFPDARIITKEDIAVSYQNIFDYKSGVFLTLFIITLLTFFIIIYDRASGLSSEAKREVGILKALGWRVDDILQARFYEAFLLSSSAYLVGIMSALWFVYILGAPLFRRVFEGYSVLRTSFELPFVLEVQTLTLVFFLTIPLYIAAILFPSWRAATLDADEVMR
ncbi:MAG: FtsX-like permease family protein [Sulfurimonadaceae bacterium]|jgi:ABC-type lipoprotein release transport system permease subunit|nr:FtsX-like permease family protein [Sulfurimonadaceae bacterium]